MRTLKYSLLCGVYVHIWPIDAMRQCNILNRLSLTGPRKFFLGVLQYHCRLKNMNVRTVSVCKQKMLGALETISAFQEKRVTTFVSVAEPEPQGAASFGRSWSRNAMWLRQWYLSWLGI
jgi:hypothetical protein